ncbi:unnamed protein product [Dicrocoelium dendriticum]|nr:unnamed protein product [Dicrocoelium dendriticum]
MPVFPPGFPALSLPPSAFRPSPSRHLSVVRTELDAPFNRRNFKRWKSASRCSHFRFHPRKPRRLEQSKITLNPNDPLNLQDLVKETERRRVEGLSPLRGDSRLNTPALSAAGHMSPESPQPVLYIPNTRPINDRSAPKHLVSGSAARSRSYRSFHRRSSRHQRSNFLPITGNYRDYYFRRDPNDRISYMMPEWFTGKDVADYGCHNGTFTFCILERFPDIRRIDAIDCDAELIANARTMQRERLRWDTSSGVRYDKINFQVANWIDSSTPTEEPVYDTIMAFSVTKWIHLNHGDVGLVRFFRRAFNLLKPGGHLILEPQPKSSYRRTRFTALQRSIFKELKIDPVKLEPLLVDLGFSYFDTIKIPRPSEPFRRKIILCSKSYGATPASIRNVFRSEVHLWNLSPSPRSLVSREPPPVCYHPQTPFYASGTPATSSDSPALAPQQAYAVSSAVSAPSSSLTITSSANTVSGPTVESPCEPDSTSGT